MKGYAEFCNQNVNPGKFIHLKNDINLFLNTILQDSVGVSPSKMHFALKTLQIASLVVSLTSNFANRI